MVSDDSLTEADDSYFDIYSTKRVTSTYNSLLEKLKSANDASRKEIIVSDRDEEENNPYTSKDTSGSSEDLPEEVANEENDFSIILDSPNVSTQSIENPPRRRSARISKHKGKQSCLNDTSNVEVPQTCPANKKRKRKQNKDDIIQEVIELSDEELHREQSIVQDLSLEDELNYEVSVKVLWMSVNVKTFHLRRFQKFTPVFEYFMKEEDVPYEKILLKVRGIKITNNDTPESIDLKVCDFIDGGILSDSVVSLDKPASIQRSTNDKDCLTIKLQDKTKTLHKFTISKDESLKIVMMKYAEQIEIPLKNIKFCYDGEVLKPGDTPASLGIENDEIIDVNY